RRVMAGHSASKMRVNALMSRPSTPCLLSLSKTWMPATSAGMTSESRSGKRLLRRRAIGRESVIPGRVVEARHQDIDQQPRLCRELAVGRVQGIDRERRRRVAPEHDPQAPRLDVLAHDECREQRNAVAFERRFTQHAAIVGAEIGGDRHRNDTSSWETSQPRSTTCKLFEKPKTAGGLIWAGSTAGTRSRSAPTTTRSTWASVRCGSSTMTASK